MLTHLTSSSLCVEQRELITCRSEHAAPLQGLGGEHGAALNTASGMDDAQCPVLSKGRTPSSCVGILGVKTASNDCNTNTNNNARETVSNLILLPPLMNSYRPESTYRS